MNDKNNQLLKGLLIGVISGVVFASIYFILIDSNNQTTNNATDEIKPLYWVAPMDANYRRDQPGQSPMGMDLVPYYGEKTSSNDSPGTVKISPNVVNNLGVRTELVSYKNVGATITGMGIVKFDEEQLFHIHSRVEGWIEKLYIKSTGDSVAKNQALYDLYSPELVSAQDEFLLALTRNNNRLIEAAENRLKSLQFSVEQITQLKKSRKTQQRVTFYSPNDGVVNNLKTREGFYIKPGDTLMSIGSLDEVWVEVDVLEKQSETVKLNQPVVMTLDYLPGRIWAGQVDFIYPTLDPMTRTLKIRLKFDNSDRVLKPDMYAQIKIEAQPAKTSLVVPTEAVIRTGQINRVVLAMNDGEFKSINVDLGQHYDKYIEIINGLEAGDYVVSSAQFLIDSESSKTSDFSRMSDHTNKQSKQEHSEMDHSKMNHSDMKEPEMDHSKMDQSEMDQSDMKEPEMDHSEMDHSDMKEPEMDHSKMSHSDMKEPEMDQSDHDEDNKK